MPSDTFISRKFYTLGRADSYKFIISFDITSRYYHIRSVYLFGYFINEVLMAMCNCDEVLNEVIMEGGIGEMVFEDVRFVTKKKKMSR